MQYSLLGTIDPTGHMSRGRLHYVPALQNKKGELDALAHASEATWSGMTPLVMVVGPSRAEDKPNINRLKSWTKRIAESVGPHSFYLDTLRFNTQQRLKHGGTTQSALELLFRFARDRGAVFIPVVDVKNTGSSRYMDVVRDACLTNERGCALKYALMSSNPIPPRTHSSVLTRIVEDLGLEPPNVDLLLDLGYLSPDASVDMDDLTTTLNSLAGISWRSATVLATGVPLAMSLVPEGTLGSLPRPELELWEGINSRGIGMPLSFGDYAIQHPLPPPRKALGMRASVRYTTKTSLLVSRGLGPYSDRGKTQFPELCKRIVKHHDYRWPAYSWGDGAIYDCAHGHIEPESPGFWRGAGTSHHICLTVDQLSRNTESAA